MARSVRPGLRSGQWVRVRTASEIAATLDGDGTTHSMPFMPEMAPYLGQYLQVARQAYKTCDTIEWSGLRRLEQTVHLGTARCDGSAHGGCQAGCLLFWKEAWLEPLPTGSRPPEAAVSVPESPPNDADTVALLERLKATTGHPRVSADEPVRWRCQATALREASAPLPWWEPTQYVRDIRMNGTPARTVLRGLLLAIVNKMLRRIGRDTIPGVAGPNRRTPTQRLDLQAGELVRVKSHSEIRATLDGQGRNRGLSFDTEMIRYCGGRFRVLRQVERIIDEPTGRMTEVKGDCVVLDGVTCTAEYHRFCPRSIYPYWREIWLERVEPGTVD